MAKRSKHLTQKEKAENAKIKKMLQEDGIIPPDKPRLNRKRFKKEVQGEWNAEIKLYSDTDIVYLAHALSWMLADDAGKVSLEQVGVLKLMKLTVEIKRFQNRLKAEGRNQYSIGEMFNEVVEPVLRL